MSPRLSSTVKLLCVIQVLAAGLLISACGGSSSTRPATEPGAQNAASEPSLAGPKANRDTPAKANRDPVTNGVVTHRPFHGTGGGEVNDDNPGNADAPGAGHTDVRRAPGPSDPCTLVSRAEAQTIVGAPIDKPLEAPLGPTCIYRPASAKNLITLTVESMDVAKITAHIRNRRHLDVSGHAAYCGNYGQPTTFVQLASGRVLTVTAPCAIGVRFAAKALPRLNT
jgi:hypothetical protein